MPIIANSIVGHPLESLPVLSLQSIYIVYVNLATQILWGQCPPPPRWAILLSAYQYDIEFKATDGHANADGLSRLPLPLNPSDPRLTSLPVTASHIASATRKDSTLSRVLRFTKTGWQPTEEDVLKLYQQRSQEITVEGDWLLWGTRVIIP